MEKAKFLLDLADILEKDETCREEDLLEEYEEWDSLAKMALMAYFQGNFSIKLNINSFDNLLYVKEILELAGEKIS